MHLARQFHNSGKNRQHPRRHTRQVGYVFVERLPGYAFALHLEVAQQCRTFLRHSYEIHQRVDIFYEYGTEVAHQTVAHVVVGCMTAAENQSLAVKHAALGIVFQVQGHAVHPAGIVQVMQTGRTHRYELALVVGGARRLGIPSHLSWPQYVFLTVAHTVNVALQFLVGVERHLSYKVLIRVHGAEEVVSAVFSLGTSLQQVSQHFLLQGLSLIVISVQFLLSCQEEHLCYFCECHSFLFYPCKGSAR